MSNTFDLAIVGGGPAGTAAAITAARSGARVLLLDRDRFPRPKVCGEFVSAESLALLGDLLGSGHSLLTSTPIISDGRLFFAKAVTPTAIRPAARSIPRFELDHALWCAAAEAGVEVHAQESVVKVSGDSSFSICTDVSEYQAQTLIHAAGRWSGVLRPLVPPSGPKWIGIKAYFSSTAADDSVDLYFFKNGYCGVQPVREGVVNVCAMVRSDVATDLAQVFVRHGALRSRSAGWSQCTESVVTAPLVHARPQPTLGQVLQVGDAAGFIDPFLGDGISLALQSGVRAARALLPVITGKVSLAHATASYQREYEINILPAFQHAARLRRILAVSQPLQPVVTGLLKLPHITEWFLQKTRPKTVALD